MKLILAIIQPSRLEAVKAALAEVDVFRVTVLDAQGYGQQRGKTEVYRGREFTVSLLRKVQLMIAVNDEFVEPAIETIVNASRSGESGEIGDGKIFVLPLEECIRIRTGQRGSDAVGPIRGSTTSKVHAVCDGNGIPLALYLADGPAHDLTQAKVTLADISVPRRCGHP